MPDSIGHPPTHAVAEATGTSALGRRFVAVFIDGTIAFVLTLFPYVGGVGATVYWLCRDGVGFDFMDRRSIGKTVMRLRPVRIDGREMDINASVRRNWMLAVGATPWIIGYIGIEVFLLVLFLGIVLAIVEGLRVILRADRRRFGDKLAGTRVIATVD